MGDRVDERAAQLTVAASRAAASTKVLDDACAKALKDVAETFHAALGGHTRYRVLTAIDEDNWALRISYFKELFTKVVEKELVSLTLDRQALALSNRRVFWVRVSSDAPLIDSKKASPYPQQPISAVGQAVEVTIELIAGSVANGCKILDPEVGRARLNSKRY